ncbi:hypothetical protein B0T20DRAFT_22882 [Sordaria brevicollis]|uniref:Uncharacterized protein n=1 Tax=Sordaria brevicollis TaxID=83679 RepID=A0AAE0PNN3_SORBR|nr:hypothetical protein B0T20DRAFT_22882 [Sordaria brevicollis]
MHIQILRSFNHLPPQNISLCHWDRPSCKRAVDDRLCPRAVRALSNRSRTKSTKSRIESGSRSPDSNLRPQPTGVNKKHGRSSVMSHRTALTGPCLLIHSSHQPCNPQRKYSNPHGYLQYSLLGSLRLEMTAERAALDRQGGHVLGSIRPSHLLSRGFSVFDTNALRSTPSARHVRASAEKETPSQPGVYSDHTWDLRVGPSSYLDERQWSLQELVAGNVVERSERTLNTGSHLACLIRTIAPMALPR